jgi:hypothetical protein
MIAREKSPIGNSRCQSRGTVCAAATSGTIAKRNVIRMRIVFLPSNASAASVPSRQIAFCYPVHAFVRQEPEQKRPADTLRAGSALLGQVAYSLARAGSSV